MVKFLGFATGKLEKKSINFSIPDKI